MNVVPLTQPSPLPAKFPDELRQLAADVEACKVTEMVVALVREGSFEFIFPSSGLDSLTLTMLAQATAIDRLRR